MIKKTIKLALIGFVIGMAFGNIIALVISYSGGGDSLVFPQAMLDISGSTAGALALQNLMSGLLGAVAFGTTILYDLDRPPLLLVSISHCAIILAAYFPIALTLGWIRPDARAVGMIACIMIAAYMVIWLVMYLRYRMEVREINELLDADLQTERA